MREIIDAVFFTDSRGFICAVAARTGMHAPEKGEWMAYIATAYGHSQEADCQYAANCGHKLPARIAAAFFPQLDITKYKGLS